MFSKYGSLGVVDGVKGARGGASLPPDLAPVLLKVICSIPEVIPFKFMLQVSLESLLYGALILHRLR